MRNTGIPSDSTLANTSGLDINERGLAYTVSHHFLTIAGALRGPNMSL